VSNVDKSKKSIVPRPRFSIIGKESGSRVEGAWEVHITYISRYVLHVS
jgi:hypothetical protein